MVDNKFIVNCIRPSSKAKKYNLHFEFNREMIDCIKLLDSKNRSYNNKVWTLNVKGLYELITMFKGSDKVHFDFSSEEEKNRIKKEFTKVIAERRERILKIELLEKNKKYWLESKAKYEANPQKYSKEVHKGLLDHIKLYPHQIVATLFLKEVRKSLLALDMGTGKSIISIAYVELMGYNKVLVITPNSLKFNYHQEVIKFTNSKSHIVNWKKNKHSIEESKYIIVNYEYFNSSNKDRAISKYNDLLIDNNLNAIICDECQKLKNTKSNIYKNFNKFFGKLDISKVFMSGTPMNNRVYELYTILNQINPIEFSSKNNFYEQYCGMTYDLDGYGWTQTGDVQFDKLYEKLNPFMYRKRKEDVLNDLPDKRYENILIELTNKELLDYKKIEKGIIKDFFGNESKINKLSIIIKLRQYLSELKYSLLYDFIDLLIENEEKVVIIDVFKNSLNKIHEKYPSISVLHTGDFSVEERSNMVNEFQEKNNNKMIFLGSVATSNFGLTLTESNKMIILTPPYTVGEYSQVVDRIYRIGQKNNVTIYLPIVEGTVDIDIFNMLMSKLKETTLILDNKEFNIDYNDVDINDILNKIIDNG